MQALMLPMVTHAGGALDHSLNLHFLHHDQDSKIVRIHMHDYVAIAGSSCLTHQPSPKKA